MLKGIKKLFYDEDADDKKVVEQPKAAPATVTPLSSATNNNLFPGNAFGGIATQQQPVSTIPPEDIQKWQNYFNALLKSAREANTIYDQFLQNIDMVSETDPNQPMANKIKLAFGFMKRTGATKQQLVDAATNALGGIVNDRKVAFDVKTVKKTKEGVEDLVNAIKQKQDLIMQKQLEIKKLTEEIAQTEIDINNNKNALIIRATCYDNLSAQLVARVKDDITGITNYIQ